MAFSDEITYDVWYTRTVVDVPATFQDSLTYTLVGSSGTVSTSLDKEGAVWRQEIYHSRRVDHQKVLV